MACDIPPAIAVFADRDVGLEVVRYLIHTHPSHLHYVVTTAENEISELARSAGFSVIQHCDIDASFSRRILKKLDFIFLAWWPKIVPEQVFSAPRRGTINLHPSFLPFNRGKHYNFWSIVEDTPFGVTMHFVDAGIDTGDLIAQRTIEKDWTDTGGTLYAKAKREMVELFRTSYSRIVAGDFDRRPQQHDIATFHWASELHPASEVFLDKSYSAKDLLNLLRARTFPSMPACYFFADGKRYEIRVSIIETEDGSHRAI
jgi:methionyl-tRNA formyltransferase